jgi:dTDP-4-dehydrorhamnose reductase
MVHISTNEVFAGDRPQGYEEWMELSPRNAYGRSKAAGEIHVRNILRQFYIVRTAWLYASGGRNFIHSILQKSQQTGQLRVVADEIGNPTYSADLADAITRLIRTHQYGTYHFVNEGACSRLEFALEVLRLRGTGGADVSPILGDQYARASTPPPFAALNNIAGAAIGITLRPWQEALLAYVDQHVPEL